MSDEPTPPSLRELIRQAIDHPQQPNAATASLLVAALRTSSVPRGAAGWRELVRFAGDVMAAEDPHAWQTYEAYQAGQSVRSGQ